MLPDKEVPDYRDLSQWVVVRILSAIREGLIEQGERLVERDVAERFSVSRAPVRDAFHKLERLGVVERMHPRGINIRAWTEHDAAEILYLMDALILLSIKLAVTRLSEEDFRTLEDILEKTERNAATAACDRRQQLALDVEFHQVIARASGHARLCELLAKLTLPIDLWPDAFLQRIVPSFSLRQHRELLAALRTGDRSTAVACVLRHQEETEGLEMALLGSTAAS